MALVSFLCFFILSHIVFLLLAERCPPWFNCGNLGHIRFPFTCTSRPECGLCVIYGCQHPDAVKEIQLVKQGRKFPTVGVTQDNGAWIHDNILKLKLNSSNCETFRHNSSLPPSSPLVSFHIKYNITLFSCNRALKINAPGYFKNTSCHDYDIYYRLPGDNSTKFPSSLTGCSRVAKDLEYLHKGCNTRILHFDIKPHNILLDEDFFPKISDFGLSKICPGKESIISMLGARGTAGYIAPEVFSRNFGGCLTKLNEEVALKIIRNDGDKEIMRKMTIVGLRCIQTDPSNRPTMGRVVVMLEYSLESLQVPPKPFLSSPPRSPAQLSTE
ncbi:Receptor-like protein kinase [Quillaja saponaria]|uniref:Receptor-like protein kinase n=1 Tax=Quillaja saponaria TaxID=32244 RepID=A0AAD7KNH8_QUISA|nr:Receptor-like protein kinase [Quillaja saponaria]